MALDATQAGRRQNLQAKQVVLALSPGAGGAFNATDVPKFVSAAESADMSSLELAWEIVSEDTTDVASSSGPMRSLRTLGEMSTLIFDSQDARSLYMTHRMLADDRLFFKQVGKGQGHLATFEARTAEQVSRAVRWFVMKLVSF